jgi:hypothetical protein
VSGVEWSDILRSYEGGVRSGKSRSQGCGVENEVPGMRQRYRCTVHGYIGPVQYVYIVANIITQVVKHHHSMGMGNCITDMRSRITDAGSSERGHG